MLIVICIDRRHTVTSAYPSPVLSVSSPLASKQPLPLPPSIHAVDVSEEHMPPKMRKNWIHKSSEALRDSYASASSGSRTPSSSSSAAQTLGVIVSHTASSLILGSSSKMRGDEMDVDEDTLGMYFTNLY